MKRAAVTRLVSSETQTVRDTCEAAMQTEPVTITSMYGDLVVITKSSEPSQSQSVSVTALTDSFSAIDDPKDLSFQPSQSQSTSQSSATAASLVDDRKFLVFDSQLDSLLSHLICPICHCPCNKDDVVKKCNEGTLLHIEVQCLSGHTILDWQSQPQVGRMAAGNLLFCASTLFSGQTFAHVQSIAEFLNLKFFSHTTFYDIQHTNLIPVIMAAWETHQQSLFTTLHQQGQPLRLCGDGRMDSPGFSAKYCCYSLMDMDSDKVLAFAIVDVTETGGKSTNMEVLAFERCLKQLLDNGFIVDVVATDRHVQIRSFMKKSYPNIRHQFDVWHVVKSVRKHLYTISHKRANMDLAPWSQSICNHLWWCAANCDHSADMLEEMWCSLVHHVVNVHEFAGNVYVKCSHDPLTEAEQLCKKWLTPLSPAHNALKEVVLNKALLKDIRQLNDFCHTGCLEVFHSLVTKYCPKRQEFDAVQMSARTALAVLDHNFNAEREQKVTSDGKPCFKVAYTKASAKWVAKPIYASKSYDHVSDMLHSVITQQETHFLEPVANSNKCHNIAPVPAPPKDELVARRISRFAPQ